jgi:hypothetical protein
MSLKSFTRSFAGGEVSPLLYGRLDLVKTQTGLALCKNFRVTPQGPVENRAGFQYVIRAKYAAKRAVLIPFSFNSQQTFVLEVGDLYMRFHTQGGTLLETAKAITGITQPAGVVTSAGHGYANGDWVFLAGIGGMTQLNGRYVVVSDTAANTFRMKDFDGNYITTGSFTAYTAGGTVARVYEIATPYVEADLFNLHYVQSADVMTFTHLPYAQRELRRVGATNWTLTTISFVPTIAAPAGFTLGSGGPGGGTPATWNYVVTAVAANTLEESLPSIVGTAVIDLTVAGNYVDIAPTAVAAAVRYNIYKAIGGVYGYIGQSDGTALRDQNITPDMSKTPPIADNPFTGAGTYPGAVSYFEQRRAFAGSTNLPQTIWLTRSGTESSMNYSIPTQDDDRIAARIVAREANTVRHLVPLGDLLALTSGGVWRIAPSGGEVLTPSSFSARPQSYVGASNVQPVVTNRSVLYVADRGAHIQEVAYKWETQTYQSEDASVLAPHLFDYKSVVQLAYSKAPFQTLWAVRDDGILLGLTHLPEHEVQAWQQHDTQGLFESVCAVAEGTEDGVYVLVKRTINGQTVRYVERQHSRHFDLLEDAFFVDAGATYDGAATSTITGLHHLEGMEVAILADGGVEPPQTVTGGTITLDAPASVVHVGLAYDADLQSMPLASEAMQAFGQGVVKNINEVKLRVLQSSGIMAGPSFDEDKLTEYRQRTDEPYGSPPALVNGVIGFKLSPSWQQDGSVCIRQSNPLPLTIVSMSLEVEVGG